MVIESNGAGFRFGEGGSGFDALLPLCTANEPYCSSSSQRSVSPAPGGGKAMTASALMAHPLTHGGAMLTIKRTIAIVVLAAIASLAAAESPEINVAQQYGVSFLPLMVMERNK